MYSNTHTHTHTHTHSFPGSSVGKESTHNDTGDRLQCKRPRFDPWVGKLPWIWKWQPTPVFLPGESLGERSLVGYSAALNMPANLENSAVATGLGKGQFSFQSQRKAMPKNAQTTTQLHSFHMLVK